MKQEAPTSLGGSSSQSSSNRHYTITGYANEEVYNKYIADCDKFTMYQKVCNVVYQSTNGRMDAEIESNTLYVTPKKFSKDELTNIKKSVWKQIQDKVFINGKYADKQEYGIKDYKGQTVISNYMYFDKKLKTNAYIHGKTFVKPGKKVFFTYSLDESVAKKYNNLAIYGLKNKKSITDFKFSNELGNGSVCGKSLIKSAKYDRLYKDFAFYQTPKEKLTNTKDRFLLFSAKLQPCYPNGYFLFYMVSFLFSTPLVLFAGAEDENVLIIILQYVVTGLWIGQWDKSGIVMAIILILILLFFIGKELRSIRKEGDLQDEEKKNI